MSFGIKQSTQFKINRLSINSKFGSFDLSSIFEELNIFDSVLTPCMSGNILIKDSVGLAKKLLFDGSEFIDIDISKDSERLGTNINKTFRVFKFHLYTIYTIIDKKYFGFPSVINFSGFCKIVSL